MAAEQAAHESSCPRVFVNGLFAQQPLAVGQVRAFDGDEEGGRRRRQRVFGPAEDDAATLVPAGVGAVLRVGPRKGTDVLDLCDSLESGQVAGALNLVG